MICKHPSSQLLELACSQLQPRAPSQVYAPLATVTAGLYNTPFIGGLLPCLTSLLFSWCELHFQNKRLAGLQIPVSGSGEPAVGKGDWSLCIHGSLGVMRTVDNHPWKGAGQHEWGPADKAIVTPTVYRLLRLPQALCPALYWPPLLMPHLQFYVKQILCLAPLTDGKTRLREVELLP